MALDRQSIEKKDFPVGRRGYDPDAVDAHLAAVAEEVAELRRTSRGRSDAVASSASDRVRAIVEAAEASADAIRAEADADAAQARDEADADARTTREKADRQAREHVGRVSDATDEMLTRLTAMQSELDGLLGTLRAGAGRLTVELSAMQGELGEVREAIAPRPAFEPETPSAAAAGSPSPSEPGIAAAGVPDIPSPVVDTAGETPELAPGAAGDVPLTAGASTPVADAATPDPEAGESEDDEPDEAARIIALNMALDGTPRADTERYLNEYFAITDAGPLLDEVYASVGH